MQASFQVTLPSSVQARPLCKPSPLSGLHLQKSQQRISSANPRVQALEERQAEATAPRIPAPAIADPFRSRLADPALAFKSQAPPSGASSYRSQTSSASGGSSSPAFNPYPSTNASSSGSGSSYMPPSKPQAQLGPRTYAPFYVYKGKGAMCVSLVEPSWAAIPGAANVDDARLDRSGDLRLEFAIPSGTGSNSSGGRMGQARAYAWDAKIQFAMSAVELGTMCAGMEPGGTGVEFQHDPNMGTPQAGLVYKTLKIKGNPDGSVFFTLFQRDKAVGTGPPVSHSISVNVSPGEFMVFKTLAIFAIPRLLGWDRDANGVELLGGEF